MHTAHHIDLSQGLSATPLSGSFVQLLNELVAKVNKRKNMQDPDLALLMDRLMRRLHFGLQERAPGFDRKRVGPGGGIVLMTLAEMECTGLAELTKRVARDKSQMSRMIQSLETKGLVQRTPSACDGRVSLVSLTPEGRVVVDELLQAVAEVIDEILAPISPGEVTVLKDLLSRVVP